jgi:myosin heavy subunit
MLQASGNDTNLLKNYNLMLCQHRSFKRPDKLGSKEFIIVHYAGEVCYDIEGFVEKNKDSISNVITGVLAQSQNAVISSIYKDL